MKLAAMALVGLMMCGCGDDSSAFRKSFSEEFPGHGISYLRPGSITYRPCESGEANCIAGYPGGTGHIGDYDPSYDSRKLECKPYPDEACVGTRVNGSGTTTWAVSDSDGTPKKNHRSVHPYPAVIGSPTGNIYVSTVKSPKPEDRYATFLWAPDARDAALTKPGGKECDDAN